MNSDVLALQQIAIAIKEFDTTPNPTRKQWIRDAAVTLATGYINGAAHRGSYIEEISTETLSSKSIKLAEEIWDKTRG